MTIELTHIQRYLWLESNVFDNLKDDLGNTIPLFGKGADKKGQNMEKLLYEFAKKEAVRRYPSNKFSQIKEYKFIIGALMEVLAEFYLKFFELNNYDLRVVIDTSENKFQKGYDFIGLAGHNGDVKIQVQVKWRKDKKYRFNKFNLKTMLEMAEQENIKDKDLYLIVVSADFSDPYEVLNFRENFRSEYSSKIKIITGRTIANKINNDLKRSDDVWGTFWGFFKESLEKSCTFQDFMI
jgi:hypothetical protein